MKILIIGSKGFIGTHVFNYFSEKHITFGADVVHEYNDEHYFQIDSTNSDFYEIFSKNEFNICINCSGAASVPLSFENPLRDFELNVNNVFKILSAIKQYSPLCKFINLSSAAVYGNPQKLPIKESHCTKPISPYGKHKYYAEQICNEFYEMYRIPTISLRIFSAYGEGLKKQFFWDLFRKSKQNGKEIILWGTGNESRDYIYIKDIVQAIELIILKFEFNGKSINLANQKEISIKEAAKIFFQIYNPTINIHFSGETRMGDPINWCADISELNKLGYQQKFSLQKGLTNYIKWLKELD